MAKKKTKTSKKEEIVPIKWHIPDNIITRFASNMVVQFIGNDFKISFFELKPEIHLAPPTVPITEVQADCVASVIVTPDRLQGFIDALQNQLNRLPESKPNK
jgi:hypothetical protein